MALTVEDLQDLLVPVFDRVAEYSYDVGFLAYFDSNEIWQGSYSETVSYIKELLSACLPEAQIVDAGDIHNGVTRTIYGWYILFRYNGGDHV